MRRLHEIFRGRRLLSGYILAAGLGLADHSVAEPAADALRLSGFGTVGVSRTSAPPGWGFQRDGSQPLNDGGTRADTDTRLGLQANYAIDPRLELVGQLLLTRRFGDADAGDSVAWAFAAYRPTENLTLRAGRIGVSVYLLADYRGVGLAYPFVRPPTEIYGLIPNVLDGFDLTHAWRDGADATWKLNGLFGQGKHAENRSTSFRPLRSGYGVILSREEQGLLVKGSVSRAKLASDTPAALPLFTALQAVASLPVSEVAADAARLQRQLLQRGQRIDYYALGLNFDRNDWLWMVEATRVDVRRVSHIDAGYALLGRRFGKLTPYVAVSAIRTRVDGSAPAWTAALAPVIGPVAAAQTQALGDLAYRAATIGARQRTFTLGMRWDLAAQAAVKLQYDRSRVNARGSLLWANGSDEAAAAHVVTATLDFVF